MIKEILKYPNPILKKKSEEVKEITAGIKQLCFDMIKIIKENNGVGLAAPQIGVLKRIITIYTGDKPAVFINPKITKKSRNKEINEEGCLSFPKLFLKIKRAKTIEAEAINMEGKPIQIKADNLAARIFQHEVDHLDGILIIDKVGPVKRWKLKKKIKK